MKNSLTRILTFIAIVIIDIAVYMLLGLLLMDYEDNWDSTKGEYGTLASMNAHQKLTEFALIAWNFINIAVLIYVGWWVYKRVKNKGT